MKPATRWLLLTALNLTASCRLDEETGGSGTDSPSELHATAMAEAVSMTTTDAVAQTLEGATAIADNFNTAAGLTPTTYTWGNPPGTPPLSEDPVGAQRMFCTAGQLLYDDPLVYPGQPGASHLHQYFGNTGTNAGSNYASLRTSGGTTCGDPATPINRSAYWVPAMLDGVGHVVKFDWVKVYYKREPKYRDDGTLNPRCTYTGTSPNVGNCVNLPNGLRFIFGYNMSTGKNGPTDSNSWDSWGLGFTCTAGGGGKTLEAVATCPVGSQIIIHAGAPNCWDGKNLDSPDHRSHMSYGTQPWSDFQRGCPASHPYVVPAMQVQIAYTVDANLRTWLLSSDQMMNSVPGSTLHMDYWEAWSPAVKATWHRTCIDHRLNCSSGDLGDKTFIKGAGEITGTNPQRLVPVPPKPGSSPTTEPTQVCPDGSVIPASQTCPAPPPVTKTCADGSVVPTTQTCPTPPPPPPTTQTCPDGTVIQTTQTCPKPQRSRKPRR